MDGWLEEQGGKGRWEGWIEANQGICREVMAELAREERKRLT